MDTLRDPLPSIEPPPPSDAPTLVPEATPTPTATIAQTPTVDISRLTEEVKTASAFVDDVLA